jgi:hypothetical protein
MSCSLQAPLELDSQLVIPGPVYIRLQPYRTEKIGVSIDPCQIRGKGPHAVLKLIELKFFKLVQPRDVGVISR